MILSVQQESRLQTNIQSHLTIPDIEYRYKRKKKTQHLSYSSFLFPCPIFILFFHLFFFYCCTPEASCLLTYHSYFQVPTHHSFTCYLFTTTHYLFLFQINFVFTLHFLFHFFPISYRSLSLSISQYHTIHTSLTLLTSIQSIFFFTSNLFQCMNH